MQIREVDDAKAGCPSRDGLEPAVEDSDIDGELGDDCISEL
jgi:hypothetical protein